MADFKTADICGASPNLNSVLEKMDSLKSSLSSSLTVSPSALSSTLSTEVSALSSSLSSMIPELPSAPDVSLQAELTALSNINISTPSGLLNYRSKLDSITNQFGDSLTSAGVSLDNLVSQVAPSIPSLPGAPSVDLCSVVPNFKLPDGATEAVESAAETLMADAPGVAEKVAEVTANPEVANVQADLKKVVDAVSNGTAYSKASTTVEIKSKDVAQTPIKVARVKDNLTSREETNDAGETVTIKERPRTVDTSVAKYFDKPVDETMYTYAQWTALPEGGLFSGGKYYTELKGQWDIRHKDSSSVSSSLPSHMIAPTEMKDGSFLNSVRYSGYYIVDRFTDTNIQLFRPVNILDITGILKDKLKKDGAPSSAGGGVDIKNYTLNRGTKDVDNYVIIPNKEQYAYIQILFEQGTVYNANFKDETRESLTT
jgi:hypothetical protein